MLVDKEQRGEPKDLRLSEHVRLTHGPHFPVPDCDMSLIFTRHNVRLDCCHTSLWEIPYGLPNRSVFRIGNTLKRAIDAQSRA
jgi:hypothetical protein